MLAKGFETFQALVTTPETSVQPSKKTANSTFAELIALELDEIPKESQAEVRKSLLLHLSELKDKLW